MLEFLKSKDDFMGQLLRHLGTSAIMDLLLRLITCIEATDTRTACVTVSLIIFKFIGTFPAIVIAWRHSPWITQFLVIIFNWMIDYMSHQSSLAQKLAKHLPLACGGDSNISFLINVSQCFAIETVYSCSCFITLFPYNILSVAVWAESYTEVNRDDRSIWVRRGNLIPLV